MAANVCTFVGNLTSDPETRNAGQSTVVGFRIAVNKRGAVPKTMYLDCSAFNKTGEIIQNNCKKGSKVWVTGELELDTWEDKTTGQNRSKHKLLVNGFEFMDGKKADVADDESAEPAKGNSNKAPF